MHIAILVFERAKKKGIFLVSAEKYFGNFFFFRKRRVAVTTMPKSAVLFVYMLKKLIQNIANVKCILTRNFAINNIYLYDTTAFIKKKYRFQQNSSWLYGHSVLYNFILFISSFNEIEICFAK